MITDDDDDVTSYPTAFLKSINVSGCQVGAPIISNRSLNELIKEVMKVYINIYV